VAAGLITPLMELIVPVEGGGSSLIFTITIPVLFGISLIFATTYYFMWKKKATPLNRLIFLTLSVTLLILFALLLYPYKN